MTPSEIKLKKLDDKLDPAIVKFNDLHSKAKHLKQDIAQMYGERARLLQAVLKEKGIK